MESGHWVRNMHATGGDSTYSVMVDRVEVLNIPEPVDGIYQVAPDAMEFLLREAGFAPSEPTLQSVQRLTVAEVEVEEVWW